MASRVSGDVPTVVYLWARPQEGVVLHLPGYFHFLLKKTTGCAPFGPFMVYPGTRLWTWATGSSRPDRILCTSCGSTVASIPVARAGPAEGPALRREALSSDR